MPLVLFFEAIIAQFLLLIHAKYSFNYKAS